MTSVPAVPPEFEGAVNNEWTEIANIANTVTRIPIGILTAPSGRARKGQNFRSM